MNGALTLQIVKNNTPSTAVELNQTAEGALMGYRLKKDSTSQAFQLAQYTMFWHHPNKICYGDAGWTKIPPADTVSDAKAGTPAAGSDDPKGSFLSGFTGGGGSIGGGTGGTGGGTGGTGGGTGGTGGTSGGSTTTTTYNGVEVTVVTVYDPEKDEYVRTIRKKSDGTVLKTEVFKDNPDSKIEESDKITAKRPRLGRLSWQEIIR
jgi:hypothetical protein